MTAYLDHKDLANETIDATRTREIADGVARVRERLAQAAQSAGRDPREVALLAATKTRDVGEIMAAIDAGIRLIGENRPQEIQIKAPGLTRLCAERGLALGAAGLDAVAKAAQTDRPAQTGQDVAAQHAGAAPSAPSASAQPAPAPAAVQPAPLIPFHLIGQLQTNKINKILPFADVVESVDSPELAERIATRALRDGREVGVLLEVNESGEESKSGCDPDKALDYAYRIAATEGVRLLGLMTIGAHVDDEATIRRGFAHLRGLRDTVAASGEPGTAECRELSMGMTGDMAFAVEEGSTIVRVGTGIFGARAFI